MKVIKDFLTAAAVIVGMLTTLAVAYFFLLLWWVFLAEGGHPIWAWVEGIGSWVCCISGVIAVAAANHRWELRHHPEKFDEHGEPLRGKGYVRAGAVRPAGPPPPKGIPPAPAQVPQSGRPAPGPLQSATQGKDR